MKKKTLTEFQHGQIIGMIMCGVLGLLGVTPLAMILGTFVYIVIITIIKEM